MADIQNQKYGDLYTNLYPYQKHSYDITTIPSTHTYRGTVEIPAGLTQKGTGTYPLVHAKDVQIGNIESDRLNDKLADYDVILRELYGRTPAELEALTDGRTAERITELEADNGVRGVNGTAGIQSLSRVADILNNRTETIDDRLLDLRIIKTIAFGAESEAITNPQGVKENIVADNNGDTLTVNPSNKWVKIFSSAANDSFTVGHLVQSITDNTGTTDFNNASVTETFDVDTFTFDEAGHVRSRHKHTYTMPKNFKQITIANGSNAVNNDVGHVPGSCVADNLTDTLTLYTGNKWINIAANRAGTNTQTEDTNDCITFSHIISPLAAGEHSLEYTTSAQEPAFGATFNIAKPMYSFTTDEAGHVTAYSSNNATVTVKIPEPSLEVAKDINEHNVEGNVIVALNWDLTNKGKLIYTPAYIGALILTGYTALNENSTGVAATDTLNAAIAKLQKQIEDEVTARIGAIEDEVTARNGAISAAITQEVSDRNGAIAAAINTEVTNRNDAITTAKEALYGETIPATDALTLKGLAEQKLDKQDFEDFKIMYNNLIDKLATNFSWDMTDEANAALKFPIENEEEPPENTGE